MWKIIEDYEKRLDKESQFVYALDKVQPVIHIYFDDGMFWKKNKVKLENLLEKKNDKIRIAPVISKYWHEFVEVLDKNKAALFPN